jgi:hypothetical protein
VLADAGLDVIRSGAVGIRDLQFVLAQPAPQSDADLRS